MTSLGTAPSTLNLSRRARLVAGLLSVGLGLAVVQCLAEAPGRQIYERGTSPSGQALTARLGGADFELPASALPCLGCHGADGAGNAEGGVTPADITWDALTRPARRRTERGWVERPAYDRRTLIRAVTLGVDAGGRELDTTMPRYGLSRQDAEDLVTFIEGLGLYDEPGIEPDVLRLGTVLPSAGPHGALAATVGRVLNDELALWNGRGGLFGRRVELQVFDSVAAADSGRVFLWLLPIVDGSPELAATLEGPVLAPFVSFVAAPPSPHVFHLLPDAATQIKVLVHAAHTATGRPPTVLRDGEPWAELANDNPVVVTRCDTARLAEITASLRDPKDRRMIFAPVASCGRPASSPAPRLVLGFPTLPGDVEATFAARPHADSAAGRLALVAADLTFEILRDLGRRPRRTDAIRALESVYNRPTGGGPPLTFSLDRRSGSTGLWLVTFDDAGPTGTPRWVEAPLFPTGPTSETPTVGSSLN